MRQACFHEPTKQIRRINDSSNHFQSCLLPQAITCLHCCHDLFAVAVPCCPRSLAAITLFVVSCCHGPLLSRSRQKRTKGCRCVDVKQESLLGFSPTSVYIEAPPTVSASLSVACQRRRWECSSITHTNTCSHPPIPPLRPLRPPAQKYSPLTPPLRTSRTLDFFT